MLIESFSPEPADFALELTIGRNDSVYNNFIALINNVKQKIGCIAVKDGAENKSYATGFMISDELLMTNLHVFKVKNSAANSQVVFHYELNQLANSKEPIAFDFNPAVFFHSFIALDYCIVAVNKMDVTK